MRPAAPKDSGCPLSELAPKETAPNNPPILRPVGLKFPTAEGRILWLSGQLHANQLQNSLGHLPPLERCWDLELPYGCSRRPRR